MYLKKADVPATMSHIFRQSPALMHCLLDFYSESIFIHPGAKVPHLSLFIFLLVSGKLAAHRYNTKAALTLGEGSVSGKAPLMGRFKPPLVAEEGV